VVVILGELTAFFKSSAAYGFKMPIFEPYQGGEITF